MFSQVVLFIDFVLKKESLLDSSQNTDQTHGSRLDLKQITIICQGFVVCRHVHIFTQRTRQHSWSLEILKKQTLYNK